jgi:hypothetical protein
MDGGGHSAGHRANSFSALVMATPRLVTSRTRRWQRMVYARLMAMRSHMVPMDQDRPFHIYRNVRWRVGRREAKAPRWPK